MAEFLATFSPSTPDLTYENSTKQITITKNQPLSEQSPQRASPRTPSKHSPDRKSSPHPQSEKASNPDGTKSSKKDQKFCLKWNNYQTNLTNVFDQMLQSESFVDVTLVCDGHSIKAHKMVLSACSPYFQSLFVDNPCQHPTIIMRDVKWLELKTAIEFMYKGEINVSQEEIAPLLRVAEMLKIRGLSDVNGDTEFSAVEQCNVADSVPNKPQVGKPQRNDTGRKYEPDCESGRPLSELRIHRKRGWTPLEKRGKSISPNMEAVANDGEAVMHVLPTPKWDAKKMSAELGATDVMVMPSLPRSPSIEPIPSSLETSVDGFEIKPEIAEMIREEERVSEVEVGFINSNL